MDPKVTMSRDRAMAEATINAAGGGTNSIGTKASSSLPASTRGRLQMLFREIEKEFESMHLENARLREKLARLEKGESAGAAVAEEKIADEPDAFEAFVLKTFAKKNAFKTRRKFKAQTSKIVSSFKPPGLNSSLAREYKVRIFLLRLKV